MIGSLILIAAAATPSSTPSSPAVEPTDVQSICRDVALEICEQRLREFWSTRAYPGVKVGFEPVPGSPDQVTFVVRLVEAGSPEAHAGVRVGDRIVELDGRPVASFKTPAELRAHTRGLVAGRETVWLLARGSEHVTVQFVRPGGTVAWQEERVRADLAKVASKGR